jgi:octaprenyl-diphosphate synthase
LNHPTGFGRLRLPDPTTARDAILPLIADELQQVEASFRANLASPARIVHEVGQFVADGGGKRVRPTLHLLCAKLCGYTGPHAVLLGTVIEFIHCATLIHDDIIDEAATRRGRPSLNRRWNNNVSVLFGDYMFAKAMEMALRAGSLAVMERLADVTLRMTEGEMLQTRYVGRLDLSIEEHLDLVERKTATLFACSAELAAVLQGDGGDARTRALRGFGHHLGMAFQVIDDLLDFTGDPETLGKAAGSDLGEGKATLAVLDLLSGGGAEDEALARRVMDSAGEDRAALVALTARLDASGALGRAHHRAQVHARQAVRELDGFGDQPAKRALLSLPDLLLFRDR